jgi:tellurium resistance protein TerD
MADDLRCPTCGSAHVQVNNQGFGVGKAAVGGILLGPVGLLGGFIGSKKPILSCLQCGYRWEPGTANAPWQPRWFVQTANGWHTLWSDQELYDWIQRGWATAETMVQHPAWAGPMALGQVQGWSHYFAPRLY